MGASREEVAAIEDYLADPACGQVGEMTLRRLGLGDNPDWSVGFVSATSGIIVAARFTALAMSGIRDPAEFRLFFLGRARPPCPKVSGRPSAGSADNLIQRCGSRSAGRTTRETSPRHPTLDPSLTVSSTVDRRQSSDHEACT